MESQLKIFLWADEPRSPSSIVLQFTSMFTTLKSKHAVLSVWPRACRIFIYFYAQ